MAAVIVIPDGPAVQVLPGENTAQATASAALAQAWAEGTEPGGPGTDSAKGWAEASAASVGAVKQRVTLTLQPDSGLSAGAWYGEFFVPVSSTFTLLRHWVYLGSGTCGLLVHVNDVNVAGPFAVSATPSSNAVTISATAGQRISFQVANITGTPAAIAVALEGLPA